MSNDDEYVVVTGPLKSTTDKGAANDDAIGERQAIDEVSPWARRLTSCALQFFTFSDAFEQWLSSYNLSVPPDRRLFVATSSPQTDWLAWNHYSDAYGRTLDLLRCIGNYFAYQTAFKFNEDGSHYFDTLRLDGLTEDLWYTLDRQLTFHKAVAEAQEELDEWLTCGELVALTTSRIKTTEMQLAGLPTPKMHEDYQWDSESKTYYDRETGEAV
jgi:hypothetical protein